MAEFSLSAVNDLTKSKLFIPDIDYILKFMDGDIGIADTILKESILGVVMSTLNMTKNAKNPNQNTQDVINNLTKSVPKNGRSDVEYLTSPDVKEFSKNNNINLSNVKLTNKVTDTFPRKEIISTILKPYDTNIKDIDDSNFDNDNWKNLLTIVTPEFTGLKPFEKSSIQSIFETMKPYAEMLKIALDSLVKIEDVICLVLGFTTGSCLNPIYNPKALGYRGDSKSALQTNQQLGEILKLERKIKNRNSSNNKLGQLTSNKTLVSETTEYSTGEFDPNYKYDYSYIDIYDDSFNIPYPDNFNFDNVDEPLDESLPEVVNFAYYTTTGSIIDMENLNSNMPDWLRYNPNNYGNFNQYSDIDQFKSVMEQMSIARLPPEFKLSFPDYTSYVKQSMNLINMQEMYDKIKDNGFLRTMYKKGGMHPLQQRTYIPRQIKVLKAGVNKFDIKEGKISKEDAYKTVWIDAESDYDLKVIRVNSRFTNEDSFNGHLRQKDQLILPNSYYGNPTDENKQDIGNTRWNFNEDYLISNRYNRDIYVVQGVLNRDTKDSMRTRRKRRYYRFKDVFKIPFRFINVIADIIAKLLPALNSLKKLLTNPTEFILNILIAKLGDNNGTENLKFLMFSSQSIQQYNQFKNILDGIKNSRDILSIDDIALRKEEINKKALSELTRLPFIKDLFYYNKETMELRFLMDGAAVIELFGYIFGIDVNFPKLDFIFRKNKSGKNNESDNYEAQQLNLPKDIKDIFGSKGEDINSLFPNNKKMRQIVEETWYSTGEYREDYSYKWIYLDETQTEIYNEASALFEKHKDLFAGILDNPGYDINNSAYYKTIPPETKKDLRILNALLNIALSFGFNDALFQQLQNIRKLLVDETSNPVIKMILELIATPVKMVKKIVDYLFDLFSSITNPFVLPTKMSEFVKMEWFTKLVNPITFLKLMGINFDPGKITKISKYIIGGLIDGDNQKYLNKFDTGNFSDLTKKEQFGLLNTNNTNDLFLALALVHDKTNIDISKLTNIIDTKTMIDIREIISVNFFESMQTLNLDQLKVIFNQEIQRFLGLLNLIKKIGKAIIQFFYSLLGLNGKKATPEFDVFKNFLDDNDITDILDGSYNGIKIPYDNPAEITKLKGNFITYDISLPDGTKVNSLTPPQLVEWISRNKDKYRIVYEKK